MVANDVPGSDVRQGCENRGRECANLAPLRSRSQAKRKPNFSAAADARRCGFYAECMAPPERQHQPAVTNTLGTNTGNSVQARNIGQVNFYGPPAQPLARRAFLPEYGLPPKFGPSFLLRSEYRVIPFRLPRPRRLADRRPAGRKRVRRLDGLRTEALRSRRQG